MSKAFISVLLVILAVSSYTNARRMISDEKISSKVDNGLMLNSKICPVGQHWYQPLHNQLFQNGKCEKICPVGQHWYQPLHAQLFQNGKCESNKDNCSKYVAATTSCSKCNLGFELKKNQMTGSHCKMTMWLIAIICVGSLFVIGMTLFIICCYCGW